MAIRINNPKVQRFDIDSPYAPLAGGKMFFYEPGQTTILKTTFSDSAGLIANANPVILDANGFEPDIFGTGSYNVVLKSSLDVQQWARNPVNFDEIGGGFVAWSATITYDTGANNIVTGSDGKYYISIQDTNINHDPNAGGSPTFWTEFNLLKQWNTEETYDADDPVTYLNDYYISLAASNTGNTPSTTPAKWRKAGARVTIQKFTASGTWTKPTGTQYIVVEVIGSGGGGAGADTNTSRTGGGGGGGGYSRIAIDATALANQTVTIGALGAGGASGANDGTAGASCSFGSLCVSTGGAKGEAAGSNVAALGGIGTTGDILVAGGSGGPDLNAAAARGAEGGSTSFGAGGANGADTGANGAAARNFGGGGGGGWNGAGTSNRTGGAGVAGIVIVTEYF